MILKQVIRYENAPAIEATWVLRTQLPDVDVPASPALYDGDGKEVVPAVEAHTRPGEVVETVVRCHAYSNHPDQIAQLRADLGADAAQYEEMIAEVAATYTPPTPEPAPVPPTCTRRQGRLALLQAGHLVAVESAITAIADPAQRMAAQIEYEADTWERDNAFLQAMWAQLCGTPEQLHDLFRLAVTL